MLIYYVIFATLVALTKTLHYYINTLKPKLVKGSREMFIAIIMTYAIVFVIAPVTFIEMIIEVFKNRKEVKI